MPAEASPPILWAAQDVGQGQRAALELSNTFAIRAKRARAAAKVLDWLSAGLSVAWSIYQGSGDFLLELGGKAIKTTFRDAPQERKPTAEQTEHRALPAQKAAFLPTAEQVERFSHPPRK
jgi:hypothetical protein